jgi:hypothetical protein
MMIWKVCKKAVVTYNIQRYEPEDRQKASQQERWLVRAKL